MGAFGFADPVPLLLFVKTYRRDLAFFARLWRSLERHNVERLPVLVSVNDSDVSLFRRHFPKAHVVGDSEVFSSRVRRPWVYQQVVKSSLWRHGICDAWFCLDSDAFFIRDFGAGDFLRDGVPVSPVFYADPERAKGRSDTEVALLEDGVRRRRAARQVVGTTKPEVDFAGPPYLWHADTWRRFCDHVAASSPGAYDELYGSFEERYGAPPSEAWFYSEYQYMAQTYPFIEVPPLFLVLHTEDDAQSLHERGTTLEELQQEYLGVVTQSNWSRNSDHAWLGDAGWVPALDGRTRKDKLWDAWKSISRRR